jgi:hypothetical protein
MTCCGFVARDGDAYIWSDGEQYLNGRPMTHQIEKVVTSAGGLAAVATGLASLCGEVRCLVAGLGGASLSDALRRLPAHLRQACAEERTHCRAIGAAYEIDLVCGLIGLCDGEMRGVVFAEAAGFEPREAAAWLSPDVGGTLPATAQEVLAVAQRQLRFVRSLSIPARRAGRSPSPASARTGSPQVRSRCSSATSGPRERVNFAGPCRRQRLAAWIFMARGRG